MISESEWLTRKKRFNGRLTALGWRIVRDSDGIRPDSLDKVAVEELPTANGPADYALFVSGKLLGIIEAKKVTVNQQNVLEQAKRYAAGAFQGVGNWDGLRVPFLYASNGELIWHLDVRPEKRVLRQLKGFHSPEALQWLFDRGKIGILGKQQLMNQPAVFISCVSPEFRQTRSRVGVNNFCDGGLGYSGPRNQCLVCW